MEKMRHDIDMSEISKGIVFYFGFSSAWMPYLTGVRGPKKDKYKNARTLSTMEGGESYHRVARDNHTRTGHGVN